MSGCLLSKTLFHFFSSKCYCTPVLHWKFFSGCVLYLLEGALVGVGMVDWNNLRKIWVYYTRWWWGQTHLVVALIKTFSVKSFYVATLNFGSDSYKFMLKTKSPSTIKTFLCLALKISISTQEVLLQRGGRCPESCLFCGQGENINHPFFTCPVGQ
jgi:hypothetical protein